MASPSPRQRRGNAIARAQAVYQTYKNQKEGKATTPAVSDAYVVDAKGKIDGLYEKGKDAEPVQALTKVAGTFRHACPLVMYEDDQSEPVLLAPWTDASLLRSYKYQKLKRGEDPIQRALEQHSLTKDGLAYNND